MTPEQRKNVNLVKTLIRNMRAGGRIDEQITPWLLSQDWPAGAVKTAMGELAMTEYHEWEIWNGHGEPPTGKVQVQLSCRTRDEAESRSPADSADWIWSWDASRYNIIAFRRVKEPVQQSARIMMASGCYEIICRLPLHPGVYTNSDGDQITIKATDEP